MNWYKIAQLEHEVYPGIEKPEGSYLDIGHGAYSTSGKKRFIWFLDKVGKFHKKEVTGTKEGHYAWDKYMWGKDPVSAFGRCEEDQEGNTLCSIQLNMSYDTPRQRKEYLYKQVLKQLPAGTRVISYNDFGD
jgi:hypothetical protein